LQTLSERKLSAFQLDKTIVSCLDEARSHLERVEQVYLDNFKTLLDETISLDSLDTAAFASTSPESVIKTVATNTTESSLTDCAKDVDIARQALLIIPLPETTPPLEMVADYLRWCDKLPANLELPSSLHTAFADLVANLLHYLDSHVQAQSGAGELLQNAEAAIAWISHALSLDPAQEANNDALVRVYSGMSYTAAGTVGTVKQNIMPDTSDDEPGDDFTTNALNRFANISQHFHDWRSTGDLSALHALRSEYTLLERRSRQAEFVQMANLSAANIQLLERVSLDHDDEKLPAAAGDLLQESIAVLPQLLNDTQAGSGFDGRSERDAKDAIPGLHELITRLETVSVAESVVNPVLSSDDEQRLDETGHGDETILESLEGERAQSTRSQALDATEQATLDVTEAATLAATLLHQPALDTSATESSLMTAWPVLPFWVMILLTNHYLMCFKLNVQDISQP